MEEKESLAILDLYIKANENKNKIVLETSDGKKYSKAEMTVLSCMTILTRSLEDDDNTIDYDRVIKTIILNSLDGKLDNLKKKDGFNIIINTSKELENEEGYAAKVTYERMISDFNTILNPIYEEELFVNKNLKLHDETRKGHIYWGVNSNRIENILEHIYGCLVLLIGIESEYGYKIDYKKIRRMIVWHETGEILTGDNTEWDQSKEEKQIDEKNALDKLLSGIHNGNQIIDLIKEFNEHVTLESKFAYLIDKLEYDMQVKMYEKSGKYDYNNVPKNVVTTSEVVQNIMKTKANGVFDVHYEYDKDKYERIPCFRKILEQTKKY